MSEGGWDYLLGVKLMSFWYCQAIWNLDSTHDVENDDDDDDDDDDGGDDDDDDKDDEEDFCNG